MNPAHVSRLKEEQERLLDETLTKIKKWYERDIICQSETKFWNHQQLVVDLLHLNFRLALLRPYMGQPKSDGERGGGVWWEHEDTLHFLHLYLHGEHIPEV